MVIYSTGYSCDKKTKNQTDCVYVSDAKENHYVYINHIQINLNPSSQKITSATDQSKVFQTFVNRNKISSGTFLSNKKKNGRNEELKL